MSQCIGLYNRQWPIRQQKDVNVLIWFYSKLSTIDHTHKLEYKEPKLATTTKDQQNAFIYYSKPHYTMSKR